MSHLPHLWIFQQSEFDWILEISHLPHLWYFYDSENKSDLPIIQFHPVPADAEKSRRREEKHKVFCWILIYFGSNNGFCMVRNISHKMNTHKYWVLVYFLHTLGTLIYPMPMHRSYMDKLNTYYNNNKLKLSCPFGPHTSLSFGEWLLVFSRPYIDGSRAVVV